MGEPRTTNVKTRNRTGASIAKNTPWGRDFGERTIDCWGHSNLAFVSDFEFTTSAWLVSNSNSCEKFGEAVAFPLRDGPTKRILTTCRRRLNLPIRTLANEQGFPTTRILRPVRRRRHGRPKRTPCFGAGRFGFRPLVRTGLPPLQRMEALLTRDGKQGKQGGTISSGPARPVAATVF